MEKTLTELLQAPFELTEISWLVLQSGRSKNNGKIWAIVAPYIDTMIIENRLDTVVGAENWRTEPFTPGPTGGLQCGISIKICGEWITKWDGAENTQIEAIKGGMSDAFKRAARRWGIGRYLRQIKADFALCAEGKSESGDTSYLKENGKRIPFYFVPPQIPTKFLPEKPKPSLPPKTQEDWKTGKDRFQKEAEEIITEAKIVENHTEEDEDQERERLKNHISAMIQEMQQAKMRLPNNQAAHLDISRKFLRAKGDIQRLREIETEANKIIDLNNVA